MSTLSKETAESQIQILLDYYEIETDDLDGITAAAMETARKRLVRAIQKGRLSIEEGDPIKVTQFLRKAMGEVSQLDYSEIRGIAKLAMKSKADTDAFGRIYALTGSLTGLGENAMASLTGIDMSIVECLGMIFLQV